MREMTTARGHLRCREPMTKHTSWRVGGPADRFYQPADLADLAVYLSRLPTDEPLVWIGLGSNLLVRDAGIRGTVISTTGGLTRCDFVNPSLLRVEAGVPCAKVARFSAKGGLTGAEFLAGIPGTLGGALAMNAGAFGGETWDSVTHVETVNSSGVQHVRSRGEYQTGYRYISKPKREWFTAAYLALEPDPEAQALERIKALLASRVDAQPIGQASCGSVFRNPPGDHAARFIEASGLKGLRIGQVRVSEKHANFMINLGGATAVDIENLICRVRNTVDYDHGIRLELEVQIIGEQQKLDLCCGT